MNHLEPLRNTRDKYEAEVRRVYEMDADDPGEFELLIAELKDGELGEGIIRYLPAELGAFVDACFALHRAERQEILERMPL